MDITLENETNLTESVNEYLRLLNESWNRYSSIDSFLLEADDIVADVEAPVYNKITKHLRFEVLDIERYVKQNDLQVITNPRAFVRNSIPSDDGLLSNRIFGITQEEQAGTFAYIDLHGWFMDPSCYKTWIRLDPKIRNCVHGIGTFSIDRFGYVVEDPKSNNTGINWLKENINIIKFRQSDSDKKKISISYLEKNRDKIFISKYLVIPRFYRDKNTENSRVVGLGGINKLYTNLIIAANAIQTTQDFMFDASNAMRGRVQECILNIYDWFAGNSNPNITTDLGAGLSGKLGLMRRTNMAKTSDFASRLVISAPELKVEKPEDMMASIDYTVIPLYAVITEFRDFIVFHLRRFFDNEFIGKETYPVVDKAGNVKYVEVDSPDITYSETRIELEIDRFLHGLTNRFVPVEIPVVGSDADTKYYMVFNGIGNPPENIKRDENGNISNVNPESILNRRMTWCDLFFIAATEAVRNKHILVTRFPVDSYTNQIATRLRISSTKVTEPMYYNNTYYPYYPKIREKDMGVNTSNLFSDTLNMSNCYLKSMCGDYDGDSIVSKGVYTEEANAEIEAFMNSKANFVNFGCKPSKVPGDDVGQSIYALTKVLSTTRLSDPVF